MPRIDPERLLKCLKPLLDGTGAIKSDKEVDKIYGLMSKFSKKLVSKCMYLNILKSTKDDVLDLFMQRGGWEMMYVWTAEASVNKNYPLLTEIGYLLLKTPATTNRLKENELPKIIKNLSRESEREDTKNVTRQVFFKWMTIAKNEESAGSVQNSRVLKSLDSSGNTSTTPYELATVNVNSNISNNDNVIVMESELPHNEFDVNQYISNADLNELDFNPEIFNNTVDQHLDDMHINSSTTSTTIFAADSTSNIDKDVRVDLTEVDSGFAQEKPQKVVAETCAGEQLSSTGQQKVTPYALVMRNGKHYLMKIQQAEDTPELSEDAEDDCSREVIIEQSLRKRPRKDPSIKHPNVIVSAGKPSMKTYGLKVKSIEATDLQQPLLSDKSSKKIVQAEYVGKKGNYLKTISSTETKKSNPKSTTKSSLAKSAIEAAKQEADEEKFRRNMAEQKKLIDLRKKEAEREKLQKEKDEATLKALKLSVTTNTKIPKIPRKNVASFSEMIGIPGVKDESIIERKKFKKRNSIDASSTPSTISTTILGDKSTTNKSNSMKNEEDKSQAIKERKHRPKVYNNTKSRSLSLLEDMELTIKEKNKAVTDTDEKVNEEKEKLCTEKDKQPSRISAKAPKRPSIEILSKPGDSKKSKSSDEKDKDKQHKDTKKKDKDKMDVDKVKDREIFSSKKVIGIQESTLFMDAITASASLTTKNVKRKRRTSSSGEYAKDLDHNVKEKNSKGKQNVSPTEEVSVKPIFNFYRDTLADDDNETSGSKVISTEDRNFNGKQSDEEKDAFEPEEGEGRLKSALILHRSKNKARKTVHWKEEEFIKEYHFFELDETERVNVARQARNFTEMKQIERSEERKIVRRNLFGVVDIMEEKMPWRAPLPFIIAHKLPIVPINSLEKSLQEERERGILEVFYFSKNQIPDSADETSITPNYDLTPPTNIPFGDVSGVTRILENEPSPSGHGFNKPGNPDISNVGLALTDPNMNFDALSINGFGFNVPPPGYDNTVQEQAPFNTWNNIPFGTGPQDIWNGPPNGDNQGFQNFANPNINMMGGPPMRAQFPHNDQFGFPPFRGRGGHMGPTRLSSPPSNHSEGPSHQGGVNQHRGRGFDGGRDREYNRDMGRDFRRDRERERDKDRRDRDRYDRERDRGRSSRDRGGRDYVENRGRRGARVPCKFFAIGKCKLGDKCEFLHTNTTAGSPNNVRADYSSRNSRQTKSDPTPQLVDNQENWDADSSSMVETHVTKIDETDAKFSDKSLYSEELRFSLPPSSPDCLPPGTEPPIIIPVIAQNDTNEEVTCLS